MKKSIICLILFVFLLNIVVPTIYAGMIEETDTVDEKQEIDEKEEKQKEEKQEEEEEQEQEEKEEDQVPLPSKTEEIEEQTEELKQQTLISQTTQEMQEATTYALTTRASTISNGIYTIRTGMNSNMVLDIDAGSKNDSANLQIWQSVGVKQQKFEVTYLNNGYYKITAVHSGKVLDVHEAGKVNGTNVKQYTDTGSDAQQWLIQEAGDGYYNIISKCNGLYLDIYGGYTANGTNVQMYQGNGSKAQKFKFDIEQVKGKQTIPNGTYNIRTGMDSNMVLDIDAGSKNDGANLQIWQSTDVEQQKFEVTYLNNGYYKITAVHSGKVLDVHEAGKVNGTNVKQYTSTGSDAQQWAIQEIEDGYYNIISKCNGLYLDIYGGYTANGTNVQMYQGNGSKAQKFKFDKEVVKGKQTISDGIYSIKTGIDLNMVLDIDAGSKADGANLQIWQSTGVEQQKFEITYLNNGYYKITAVHSQKVLDVYNGNKTNGTNVWQYRSNDTDSQQWIIQEAGDGYYNIISKCNGLYLDIYGGNTSNGTNVQMYEGNGSNAQKFKFDKKEVEGKQTIPDGTYSIRTGMNSNMVLDIDAGSKNDGANLQIWQSTGVYQQRFEITYLNNGFYRITAIHSGKVLDVHEAGKVNGTNVKQYTNTGSDAQQWIIQEAGDGYYNIISKCNGLYLDIYGGYTANGTNVQMYEGNGSNAQKFRFNKEQIIGKETIQNGIYNIKTGINANMVLDIDAGSMKDGANLQIWQSTGVQQQKFEVTYLNNGCYKITALHSQKVLDVDNGKKENGTNVKQYASNGGDAQQWMIQDIGDGYYNIVSKCNGLYLDVYGGYDSNGTNVQMYERNGSNAQKFRFEPTTASINKPSNFMNLDESQYPGYKSLLQKLQNDHPNWIITIKEIDLDWNTVLDNEDIMVTNPNGTKSPRSLTQYTDQWRQGIDYDGWYRATREAIAYMMDPRNSLDEEWIFQFQDLTSSAGTYDDISKMIEGTFLTKYPSSVTTKNSIINTILSTSRAHNISPFHIVARMIQETNGGSALNGYQCADGTIVYNLFNIGATGNSKDEIIANGANYAYNNRWLTPEMCIEGSVRSLNNGYFSKGQTTLYFQKYNVVNKNGLYSNQYMQNIRAANDEGNSIYYAYKGRNLLDSQFEFVIPVYKNMPRTACPRPAGKAPYQ